MGVLYKKKQIVSFYNGSEISTKKKVGMSNGISAW